jgi:hypothetical protein
MQGVAAYQAERRELKVLNGKMHAAVWGCVESKEVRAIQKEIEANVRRQRTVDYMIRWLCTNGDSDPGLV